MMQRSVRDATLEIRVVLLSDRDSVEIGAAIGAAGTSDGNQDVYISPLSEVLERVGLKVLRVARLPHRKDLVAQWRSGGSLVLRGHVDTAPFTGTIWPSTPCPRGHRR